MYTIQKISKYTICVYRNSIDTLLLARTHVHIHRVFIQTCDRTQHTAINYSAKSKSMCFLDTQVSLAPTHVSWLVGWLVGPSHFRISNLWSVTVDQIKKLKKQSPSIFEFCFWKNPPHPQKCI